MYKDGKFVGTTAMMLGTNKQSAVALARELSVDQIRSRLPGHRLR
jgi:hypothetical protein